MEQRGIRLNRGHWTIQCVESSVTQFAAELLQFGDGQEQVNRLEAFRDL
jgi:hypothetical protein